MSRSLFKLQPLGSIRITRSLDIIRAKNFFRLYNFGESEFFMFTAPLIFIDNQVYACIQKRDRILIKLSDYIGISGIYSINVVNKNVQRNIYLKFDQSLIRKISLEFRLIPIIVDYVKLLSCNFVRIFDRIL